MWKGQTPFDPNPTNNSPNPNNQTQNHLPAPFAPIVQSSGVIPANTQMETSSPIGPGSASNMILTQEPTNISDASRASFKKTSSGSKIKSGKLLKQGKNSHKMQNNEHHTVDEKTEKNRERNREHARSTRLRKKAYIQKLKDMAHGLRAVQTKEIRERRMSMQNMMNIQKVRRAVVQTVLDYHSGNERDPSKWNVLLENSFWMKSPVTPFRCFRRSEVDGDSRIVRGVDGMICDAASVAVMVERIGCHNARWRRIKRSDFIDTLDDRDVVNEEICMAQQPESSLSSESNSDSSQCSETKRSSKRKQPCNKANDMDRTVSTTPKVSSSSESCKSQEKNINISSESELPKTNISSSDEAEKKESKKLKMESGVHSFQPTKVSRVRSENNQHPVLSRSYLHMVNTEPISAVYAVNQDDMILLEDVLMCPYVFRTKNAVLCGALADCVVPGMLRAHFSKNNKLLSMELVFDAMGFMQQLDGANGGDLTAQVIPGSLETALVPCPHEARIITEASPPYAIVHVNESWTKMTQYSQMDVEGKPLLPLLQGKNVDSAGEELSVNTRIKPGRLSHKLEDVSKGRSACSTSVHYVKNGKPFVDFMCSYPLTKSNNPFASRKSGITTDNDIDFIKEY
eukprot:jgi/Psemu1/292789/fgenesh1_pg.1318_\